MSQQDQPLPARQTGGSFERSSGNLDTYRFTFDCKSTKSIKGSCLDPDVSSNTRLELQTNSLTDIGLRQTLMAGKLI